MIYGFRSAWLMLLLALAALSACGDDPEPGAATGTPTARRAAPTDILSSGRIPLAIGNINRLSVVADPEVYAGPVGDSIRYNYGQAYPLMPAPEPTYDLHYVSPDELRAYPIRREFRTYLFAADLSDPNSPTTRLVRSHLGEERLREALEDPSKRTAIAVNRWAQNQLLIYLMAPGTEELADLVARSFESADRRIRESDRAMLRATMYQGGRNSTAEERVTATTGLQMEVPYDFQVAHEEPDFVWLRRDFGEVVQNLLVSRTSYTGREQLTEENLLRLRDSLGQRFVRSNTPGSYATTARGPLGVFSDPVDFDGRYAFESRGLWEMTEDFMGGPFVSYLVPDEEGNLYLIDGFIFAPGEDKRNYMQQLEEMARTAITPR